MRPPSRKREHGLKFNVTPLIDVVFLLIIFFLAASHFARSEEVVPEEIEPVALDDPEADDEATSGRRLVATFTAAGTIYVRGEAVDAARLKTLITQGAIDFGDDFEVRLRCDRRLPFGTIEPLLLACAEAGVRDLKFTVKEER